jgi:hypothetical protein
MLLQSFPPSEPIQISYMNIRVEKGWRFLAGYFEGDPK